MKSRAFFLSILLGPLVAGPSVWAQEQEPPKAQTGRFGNPTSLGRHLQDYIYGVVKKVGDSELVLDKTEFGDDQSFKVDSKTKFDRDGKASQLSDLKIGDKVFVQMKKDKKTGEMLAKKVVCGIAATAGP